MLKKMAVITSGLMLMLASQLTWAYNQNLSQLYLRGTSNNWSTSSMQLVADNQWQVETTFGTNSNERFKLDVHGDWSYNFGDNNNDGYVEINGNDILISEGAGDYRISFNDVSYRYTIEKIASGNQKPIANAGADITIEMGEVAEFNASQSTDPDGQIVSYEWSNSLSGVTASEQYNTAGTYTVMLSVTDDKGATATDTVTVTVVDPKQKESSFAQLYFRGTANNWTTSPMALVANNTWQIEVEFGAASDERFKVDVNGDWSHNYGDTNKDGIAGQSEADVLITEGEGSYRITFNDANLHYSIEKLVGGNQKPIANAGADITIDIGEVAEFNSSQSTDPDGQIVSYEWSNNLSGVIATKQYNTAGNYSVTLSVTDNEGAIATDTLTVTVVDPNQKESNFAQFYFRGTANNWLASPMTLIDNNIWQIEVDFAGGSNERFKFDVYADWSLNYGDGNADGQAGQSEDDISVTDGAGKYRIIFNDASLQYSVVKVDSVNQKPVADIENKQTLALKGRSFIKVNLNAENSYDVDGEIVDYSWFIGHLTPSENYGVSEAGQNDDPTSFTFYDKPGTYYMTLVVLDNEGAFDYDFITITVLP